MLKLCIYDIRWKCLNVARQVALDALEPACPGRPSRTRTRGLEVCSLSDARHGLQEHLGYVWTTLVKEASLVPKEGELRWQASVDSFLRFTDKPMVAAKEAMTAGLARTGL